MYDRRAIFLRAHQLHTWNRRPWKKYDAKEFGRWLAYAWNEAKAGTLPSFTPAAIKAREIEATRLAIECLENQDRLFTNDYARLRALQAELQALAA